MKVLSYNIHKGFSTFGRRFVLKRIREVLEITDADLVFLQEVQGEHQEYARELLEWPDSSQFEFLANRLWPHFAYGKNAVYNEGHHGNAILSKYGFVEWENIDVSTNNLERRGMLHGVIHCPGLKKDLHAICMHLDLREAGRRLQVHMLLERINEIVPKDSPLIVAGDFNDWRQKAGAIIEADLSMREVYKTVHGVHARTFPSWLPTLRLDRIYVRGLTAVTAECLTGHPWDELSDHCALFAELSEALPITPMAPTLSVLPPLEQDQQEGDKRPRGFRPRRTSR